MNLGAWVYNTDSPNEQKYAFLFTSESPKITTGGLGVLGGLLVCKVCFFETIYPLLSGFQCLNKNLVRPSRSRIRSRLLDVRTTIKESHQIATPWCHYRGKKIVFHRGVAHRGVAHWGVVHRGVAWLLDARLLDGKQKKFFLRDSSMENEKKNFLCQKSPFRLR